ncbi:MAG: acetate kinase, partial [Candidatus Omnitrophica bacterium]|nr:acetate kinase [Candidatus Omnitrophota bacterium]
MLILVLNCGSSSVKYQLYDMPKEKCLAKGIVEKIGQASVKSVIQQILNTHLAMISQDKIAAVGHRVVHGGEKFKRSTLIGKKVIQALKEYSRLAPLHNPPNLAGIQACQHLLGRLPQAAVFDTAFHQSMPAFAYLYGLPYASYKKYGIRRYGFHGTSHRYVAYAASKILGRRLKSLKIISCHLGNGCSITAIDRGKSVDTSMGFTPLEGLVMGTRCGDIDPAAVLYLMKKQHLSIAQTDALLNKSSGLLGLSGKSNDMRDILRLSKQGNRRAQIALDVFIYRIKKYIGAYLAAMNGCDALVFTAGIGEKSVYVRNKIKRGVSALLNKFKTQVIVMPTNEELMIARDTYKITSEQKPR